MERETVQQLFLSLVQIDSHSLHEGAMAKRCREELERLGLQVQVDGAGEALGGETGNLIGILPGSSELPKVLLAAHMDTVRPGEGIRPRVDEHGVVWSDGSTILGADDKAGITAILTALKEIRDAGLEHGQIQVVFTIGEEIGLQGAKQLKAEQLDADFGLSLDSSGDIGTIAIAGPGQTKFEATVTGVRAHAGVAPEKGISAIKVAAHAVSNMPHGRIDDETTANIGSFVGEGPTNVVADRVTIVGEARSRNPQKMADVVGRIESAFQDAAKAAGAEVEFLHQVMYEGFDFPADHPLRKRIETSLTRAGFKSNPVKVGGGSDANVIQTLGVPILNIGVGYEDIHSTNEHIAVQNIVDAAKIAVEFCTLPLGE
ncbi:M20/M25/M40 family metallo-hydrolase [Alicyclobacillus fastidiosus]|uniref:M20/M25/M40 family metallo-hydrolase n=1 Tax=Alicyclobacillus fastidiosus TaxID=392011 RepID=A0ABV5AG57_9BACL|nr:M20/M25/M40 family metallo-hydrolase [Alicyclobacillus fastidiosus]WEH11753.1 M20/M25/M40 family metallo-hydrolase [Alicyclobacillus fastidiosus]